MRYPSVAISQPALKSVTLMVKIAPLVGSAKTQELLYARFVKMCTCQINFVRKECATAFPVMCEVLGNEVFEKNLLPIFMKLCEDVIWTVRKACAEVMPFIALLCTLEKRRKVLVPIYKKFMFDTSLWVIKAALKNLGRFMATFAPLQILGLAYNQNLELSIVNAADESFEDLMENARQLTYCSQPATAVLLKNFASYEKRFKDSIQRHALLSLVKSDEEPWKSRSEDRSINVEAYLSSVVFVEENLVQRQSTGSTSDDGGGISKLADFYYVRHKSLSSSSSIASTSPTPSPLYRANQSYDEKNPLNRFMRYCSPLKNNFEHSFGNPSGSDGGDQGGGSDAFDNHGHWDSEDDNFASHHLPDLSLGMENAGLGGPDDDPGTADVIFDSDNPKHDAAAANGAGLDFIMESAEEDENTIDECFNSHQFWYISPGLALDLEFIDTDAGGDGGSTDASNNNNRLSSSADGGNAPQKAAAGSTGGGGVRLEEDDTRNNNLTQQRAGAATNSSSSSSPSAMVVEDNENQNDSDSSYGSINNNESENKLLYMYEDLLIQTTQSSSMAGAAGPSTSSGGNGAGGAVTGGTNSAGSGGGGGTSGGAGGSSSSTATPTMTTVERIRASEQLKTMIRWENEEVEWNLLEDFLHMKNVNKELCLDCAYNFPAVVLTFGDKFWPILSRYFFDLCADVQDSVRRTMAASISKVALIIGREQATRDLVQSYTEFLLDSDDIKFEVVRTLAEFLKVIDSCEHETLMNHLGMCLQPPLSMMNWRFRELAGQQIVELARMHTKIRKENCLLFLTGLSLRLMLDKYDSVRKAGIDAFVECSHEFQQNDKVFEFFNKHFAFYSDWRRRQTYVIAAGKMSVLLNAFLRSAAKFANDPQLEPTLQKLRNDKDCDVRGQVDGYQSMEEEMAAEAAAAASGGFNAAFGGADVGRGGGGTAAGGSSSSSFSSEPVSSHLSYAEVTSGYLGSAMSSLALDDHHVQLAGVMRILKRGDDGGRQEEDQEVQLAETTARDTEEEEHEEEEGEGDGDDEEEECGEEAIEQPTSSMSTDDDAAYCSEMESSAASTPSVGTLPVPTLSSSPEERGGEEKEKKVSAEVEDGNNGNSSSSSNSTTSSTNSQEVVPPSAGSAQDFPELLLAVNGESGDGSPTTTTTATAKGKKTGGELGTTDSSTTPTTTTTTTTTPKMKDNFFRRRSKGKK
ncbi:hypothetical protein ZHAS_00019081 [Anopheles sinensis]|uniref:Serine/threonine-protein phosphatase 4 regulatory subunit 1 n=1 Tax=Anopheles sinensis TaxID=74873 RepID=A0A084WLD7_ANOSI|nr:hypothetical protein ZHAS_00019081 [Anopheles sinensis]